VREVSLLSDLVTTETRGDLEPGVLPLLLRRVHVIEFTGFLRIRRGEEQGSFCFVNGQFAWGETNIEECRLGACLVRHGRLTEGDQLRASLMVGEGQRLGDVLVELGLLDEIGLAEALALHVREMLMTVVSWSDGTWELEESLSESEHLYAEPLPVSAAEIVLDAVWSLPDPFAISFALGDLSRPLVMSAHGRLRAQQVSLAAEDGFILSRVDGVAKAHEVLDISGLERAEAERRLLALICIGIVDYEAPRQAPRTWLSAHRRPTRAMAAAPGPTDPYAQDHVVPLIRLSLGPEPAADAAAPVDEAGGSRPRLRHPVATELSGAPGGEGPSVIRRFLAR
jgi:hypothetical protein